MSEPFDTASCEKLQTKKQVAQSTGTPKRIAGECLWKGGEMYREGAPEWPTKNDGSPQPGRAGESHTLGGQYLC